LHDLLENSSNNLTKTKQALVEAESSIKTLEEQKSDLILELEQLRSSNEMIESSPSNNTEVSVLRQECQSLKNSLHECEQARSDERRELIKEAEIAMSELRREKEKVESEAYSTREMLSDLNDERVHNMEKVSQLESKCSVLENENTRMQRSIRRLEKEKDAEIQNLCHDLSRLRSEIDDVSRQSAHAAEKCRNAEEELDWSKKELSAKKKEIEALAKRANQSNSRHLEEENKSLRHQANNITSELEAKIQSMTQQMSLKDERIEKLEKTKLTKDKIKKWKQIKDEHGEYKKRLAAAEKALEEMQSARVSSSSDKDGLEQQLFLAQRRIEELQSSRPSASVDQAELANMKFAKDALEGKLKKYLLHCQRLEDEKGGIREALRSSKLLDENGDDLATAVVSMSDRIASLEKQLSSGSARADYDKMRRENSKLREMVENSESVSRQAISSLQKRNEDLVAEVARARSSTDDIVHEKVGKIRYLEEENLKLMKGLKESKRNVQSLRSELTMLRNQSIDEQVHSTFASANTKSKTPNRHLRPDERENRNHSPSVSNRINESVRSFRSNKEDATGTASFDLGHQNKYSRSNLLDKENSGNLHVRTSNNTDQLKDTTQSKRRRTPGLGESLAPNNEENTQECQQS